MVIVNPGNSANVELVKKAAGSGIFEDIKDLERLLTKAGGIVNDVKEIATMLKGQNINNPIGFQIMNNKSAAPGVDAAPAPGPAPGPDPAPAAGNFIKYITTYLDKCEKDGCGEMAVGEYISKIPISIKSLNTVLKLINK